MITTVRRISIRFFGLMLMLGLGVGQAFPARAEVVVTIYAAASLKNALDDVVGQYQQQQDVNIVVSYAGSSALARQIQYGAPAQIFISANALWMDEIEAQGFLVPGSRVNLAGNKLVMISGTAPTTKPAEWPEIRAEMDLSAVLRGGRLAMALVDAVPAGIYGRAALMSLGQWPSVKAQIAQTDNVRAALRLVALGEAPLGIVYATDAVADPRVSVLGVFPKGSHPEIMYPAARLTEADTPDVAEFFEYLTGPEAGGILIRHGFSAPRGSTP